MGRPKKNAAEQPLKLEGDKLFNEQQKAAESGENAAQNENVEQEPEEKEVETLQEEEEVNECGLHFELDSYADIPRMDAEDNCFIISFLQDVELYDGRLMLKTGIIIKDGYVGFVSPTEDNAYNGLKVENGIRLTNSDVICMKASKNVKIVLNIGDDVFIQEQTNFGTRPRRIKIPAHTPVAKLVLFKQ